MDFEISFDTEGNLYVMGGWVRNLTGSVKFLVGPENPQAGSLAPAGIVTAEASARPMFIGGSGRNLVMSGFPDADLNGAWRAGSAGVWERGEFRVQSDGSGGWEIVDGTDTLATLASGPVGDYASTTYGATLLGSAFTATAEDEWNAPGATRQCLVLISAGRGVGGVYQAVDADTYQAVADSDWKIEIASDGTAELKDGATVVATRAIGNATDPAGVFVSVAGSELAPGFSDAGDFEVPDTGNPFGILTISYVWTGAPDLDTTTNFLGEQVGYPGPYTTTYLTHTGDATTSGGHETVTIDLAQAFEDGLLAEDAEIYLAADWYPPAGGSGPAVVTVTYSVGDLEIDLDILPARLTPSATRVAALRVGADGSVVPHFAPWTATVSAERVPVPEGVVFLTVTESAGTLASVAGPFFAAELPTPGTGEVHFLLGSSDGLGTVKQEHLGPVVWR